MFDLPRLGLLPLNLWFTQVFHPYIQWSLSSLAQCSEWLPAVEHYHMSYLEKDNEKHNKKISQCYMEIWKHYKFASVKKKILSFLYHLYENQLHAINLIHNQKLLIHVEKKKKMQTHSLNSPITDTFLLFQWLFPISEQAKNFVSS